jgi:F-type H+-transporting ATPase subunit delta
MRVRKETRRLARALIRASFKKVFDDSLGHSRGITRPDGTLNLFLDTQLDKGRISSVVQSLIAKKPRNYIKVLEDYKRLLRLEVEKRRARIESAGEMESETRSKIVANLKKKYGSDLTTEFVSNPALLGGVRIRVGSDVWDGSVRNRLQRLEQQL